MTKRQPRPTMPHDPDPPNVRLAIGATLVLLRDLSRRREVSDRDRERIGALLRALTRLRDHLDRESTP